MRDTTDDWYRKESFRRLALAAYSLRRYFDRRGVKFYDMNADFYMNAGCDPSIKHWSETAS